MKRKNKRIINIVSFILGIISPLLIVKGATYINGSNVGYSGSLSSDNVQDAIDELYTKIHTKKKIEAWEYNEKGNKKCINGEEDTCVRTDCYKSGSTCSQGTVIKYYVNDNEFRYFYVLRDNGTTITMQQRENTVRNIEWHAGVNNNNYGPDTVLQALEQSTSTWTNVNVLEYTPGTTILYENAYTGCTNSGGSEISGYIPTCNANTYTLSARKARARMISLLEASSTGCLVWKDGSKYPNIIENSVDAYNAGSCPDFMYNYLNQSTSYGGSYNDNTQNENGVYNYDYWTMSVYSDNSVVAWVVGRAGHLYNNEVADIVSGARAVVEISKSNL